MKFAIIIPTYNERKNIKILLSYLKNLKLFDNFKLEKIYVVDSNSIDGTTEIVEEMSKNYELIKLIKETKREGKISAIKKALKETKADIIFIWSADAMITYSTIYKILEKFKNPKVGGVVLNTCPILSKRSLAEKTSAFSWLLLNETFSELSKYNLIYQLGGDVYAFRNKIFEEIPLDIVNEDAFFGLLIRSKGYLIEHLKDSYIFIHSTKTINELIKQRERINFGHRLIFKKTGKKTTILKSLFFYKPFLTIKIILNTLIKYFPMSIFIIFFVLETELISTFLSYINSFRKDYIKWEIAFSTKETIKLKDLIKIKQKFILI